MYWVGKLGCKLGVLRKEGVNVLGWSVKATSLASCGMGKCIVSAGETTGQMDSEGWVPIPPARV